MFGGDANARRCPAECIAAPVDWIATPASRSTTQADVIARSTGRISGLDGLHRGVGRVDRVAGRL